jgi:hypothetical protein
VSAKPPLYLSAATAEGREHVVHNAGWIRDAGGSAMHDAAKIPPPRP